jgi:hypothetical protein
MRRTLPAALALVAVLVAAPAHALDTTCTIAQVDVAGTFPFNAIGGSGLALPVHIDEASGAFSLDRTPWDASYGANGLEFNVGFGGVHGFLSLGSGAVQGTIDGAGQIVLPAFACRFGTDYLPPITMVDLDPTISTGLQVAALGGENRAFEGVALDFTSGSLTLVGVDKLQLVTDNLTGPRIRCRLDAVPDANALPHPATLRTASGRVQTNAKGSRLLLTAQVAAGGLPVALDGSADVVVRLRAEGATTDLLLVRVRSAQLSAKGKAHQAADTDGSAVEVLTGRDTPAAGKLIVKSGKKGSSLKLDLTGVSLAGASGGLDLAVVAGARTIHRGLAVHATRHGMKLR